MERRNREVHADEAHGDPRRRGRGWGPFSGGQLTVIILAVLFAIALPVGAFAAVSGSNVFVTDATAGTRAGVTSAGKLKVDTGLGIYGLLPTLSQGGIVYANAAPPNDLYSSTAAVLTGTVTVAAPPAAKALVLQNLVIDWDANGGAHFITVYVGTAGCATQLKFVNYFELSNVAEFRHVSLEPGLVVPANAALCVKNSSTAAAAYLAVTGYQVAASSVAALNAGSAPTQSLDKSK